MKLSRTPRLDMLFPGALLGLGALLGPSLTSASTLAETVSAPPVARKASAVSAAELAQRVKAALHADPNFYDLHVDVSVHDGAVVLSGLVLNNREMLEAVRTANIASQGRKVINNLEIEKTSPH